MQPMTCVTGEEISLKNMKWMKLSPALFNIILQDPTHPLEKNNEKRQWWEKWRQNGQYLFSFLLYIYGPQDNQLGGSQGVRTTQSSARGLFKNGQNPLCLILKIISWNIVEAKRKL